MSTEPYVPNEQEIIEGSVASEAEARRGIAKIKADALREVANDLAVKLEMLVGGRGKLFVEVDRLLERADRVEEEA